MVEVSNNLIAGLLLIAIVISGLSVVTISNLITVPITGFAGQGTGTANVSITGEINIEMVRNYTDFGGSQLGGADQIIDTQADNYDAFDDGTEGNGSTSSQGSCATTYDEDNCAFPFVVRNIGNQNITIIVSKNKE